MEELKSPGWIRGIQIGLGAVAVILSIFILINPALATVSIVLIASIILLIVGIEQVIHGWRDRLRRGWSRGFRIGVGALEIGLSIAILVSANIGATLVGILIAIALLIAGIQIIIAGIFGRRSLLRRATDR